MPINNIGANVRALRKIKKMTLQALENLTGLSRGYLSRVERGLKLPPFSTLNQLGNALGVDVIFLLKDNHQARVDPRICFTKKGEGEEALTGEGKRGYRYEALSSNKLGKNMIPYIIDVSPDENQVYQHEGEEFHYVLEGQMEFSYGGETYMMEEGDSVYFDSSVPHSGKARGKGKTKILAVMYNYKRL